MSRDLFPADLVVPVPYQAEAAAEAEAELAGLSLEGLGRWEHGGLNLGGLCLPGLRWALRRHHLPDDEPTRGLFRRYLRSAASLARRFDSILNEHNPCALVVFNGIMYPEAVARAVAMRRGIPVITHEVGLRPYSAFFSHGHATFREVELPSGRELTPAENERLDSYLSDRFRGMFTMAGIRFWPEMEAPPNDLLERMGKHGQTVVVFTNVIFDTSQVHANTLYPDMFAWLEDVRAAIAGHPETFFVIRAHPDEDRPWKESQESVAEWVRERHVVDLPNVAFFGPSDYVSSYELIRRSKFVLVYNSSIGLEASIMGAPVLCAGRARYTQVPTVFFPATRQEFLDKMGLWLAASAIDVPAEFVANARRFLDYELYHASLDLSQFLGPYPYHPGMVEFRPFEPPEVRVAAGLCAIKSSIPTGGAFLLP
jgi:UDP-N-acetylglucosamine 2-epimerase